MRIWSVQPLALYERLKKEQALHCGISMVNGDHLR